MTLLVFVGPALYVFRTVGHGIFSLDQLAQKIAVSVALAIIVWLIYGVACLFAAPIADTTKHPNNDKPDMNPEQKPNKRSAPKESRKRKKWLVIALAFIVVLATISLGGFYIIKNKVSAYLENLVEKNPIYFAAATGNLQEVDRLISEGANPNAKGVKGHTPLIAATRGHHSLIAEQLLLAGANPDQKDDFGWAALHHAITPVDGADSDLISILVKHGANVNIQDNRLRTPLHRAAQYGELQAVLLLLKYRADPNIKDYNGWTPADRAALHPEIQSLLISGKSDSGSQVSELTIFPEYFSEKHSFKGRFPGKAKVTDYGLVTHYTVEIEGEGAYNIIVNPFPKPVLGNEVIQAALDGHLQGRLVLFGDDADLLESRYIVFAGHKALQYEYTVETQGTLAYFEGLYFIVGKFGYGVSCVCTEETKPLVYSKYKDFVESFRLTGSH
jgi:hypothetical protein